MSKDADVDLFYRAPSGIRPLTVYRRGVHGDAVVSPRIAVPGPSAPEQALTYEWSASNPPWDYSSISDFTQGWGSPTVVDLYTGGLCASDLQSRVTYTLDQAAANRAVIRLPVGTQHITSCPPRGSSGDILYAFGVWDSRLKGFLGAGPDKTFVQLDAGSISSAQITKMATLDPASFDPLQLAMARFDGTMSDSVLLGGVTFCAADQPNIAKVHANLTSQGVVVPQPAPHGGIVFYPGTSVIANNCRFIGCARAMSSAPPFEMANVDSQYAAEVYRRCDFDGRLASWINAAQPRRCTPCGGNNEASNRFEDCWIHHTNLSRFAANDQNRDTSGSYTILRCKVEHISDTRNVDPALNGGVSLGGYDDPQCVGWESVNGTITVQDSIICNDNPSISHQSAPPMHYGLTSVGSRNPRGGRMIVNNVTHRNSGFPTVNGFACFRVGPTTYWAKDGFDSTITVYSTSGRRLSPHKYTSTWPPSAAYLAANNLTPQTHFIVRSQ